MSAALNCPTPRGRRVPRLLAGLFAVSSLCCLLSPDAAAQRSTVADQPKPKSGAAPVPKALAEGTPVLPADALASFIVEGENRTNATASPVAVTGQPFRQALRILLRKVEQETNETQLVARTTAPVEQGDALLLSLYLRGDALEAKAGVAQVGVVFERSEDPWTKSIMQTVSAPDGGSRWKRVVLPFTAAESYAPGKAMLSIRLAYRPQTVEIGGVSLLNFGKKRTVEELRTLAAEITPLGPVTVTVNPAETRQTIGGFGGNYAKGRGNFGLQTPNDAVGAYTLENLDVAHARVGIPLMLWEPENDNADPNQADMAKFRDEGIPHSVFVLMQDLNRRNIPLVASAWDVPNWMVADPQRSAQRVIPGEKYGEAIEAFASFLLHARDKYGVTVPYVSFNESDGGYQVKFTAAEKIAFIKQAGKRFAQLGLTSKWLTGDTANGRNLVSFARPQLEDPEVRQYLGPVSFHSWDALQATAEDYAAIATLAKQHNLPVWCLELGYDPQLWRANPPVWPTWDNALRLAEAYWKTLYHAQASVLDYWEYQADYPLVGEKDGKMEPYPAFHMVRQMATHFKPGAQVIASASDNEAVLPLAAQDKQRGRVVVQLINTGGTGQVSIAGLPPGTTLSLVRTSESEQMKAIPGSFKVGADGRVTLPLASRSVSTLSGTLR